LPGQRGASEAGLISDAVRNDSASYIQRFFRRIVAQKQRARRVREVILLAHREAALTITGFFRTLRTRKLLQRRREDVRLCLLQSEAAGFIQRSWRAYRAKRRWSIERRKILLVRHSITRHEMATLIQSTIRMFLVRRRMKRMYQLAE
jgi:hypothetical protein